MTYLRRPHFSLFYFYLQNAFYMTRSYAGERFKAYLMFTACILKTLRARPFSPEQLKNAEKALYFQRF